MPVTVGADATFIVPGAVGAVAAESLAPGTYPGRMAVTRTEKVIETWAAFGVYVVPVAPGIGTPFPNHW
jgi:hypothetical protein